MERVMTLDQVRLLFHEHLVDSIAPFLGALFSGGLVALGLICIVLLSPKGQEGTKQRHLLRIYVAFVVTFVLEYQVEAFIALNVGAFRSFYEPSPDLIYVLTIVDNLLPVVIITLTDGLLVWRCFMVQRTLSPNNSKLQVLFWIISLCLWIITIVSGFIAVGLFSAWRECRALSWCNDFIRITQAIAVISNLTLNLFATSYIVIRLLIHRRNLIYLYELQRPTSQLTCIITILLESSAINVPVAIIAVVHICTTRIVTNFIPLFVACQAFMSILIIHQVAIGRAIRQNHQMGTLDDIKETNEERATVTDIEITQLSQDL